ncbi:MAG: hypothetical protein LBI47_01535 [Puniceicoccales bacterium]|jgi:hypothetical protein|nr:hypothetical protein [Puniceicoccales bacterium]
MNKFPGDKRNISTPPSPPPSNPRTPGGARQSSSVEGLEVRSAPGSPESNPQPLLSENQKALKDKFGLNEHACAVFDAGSSDVKTFVKDLKGGKFDPNILKRFLLWLSSKFGGPEYNAAVQQFRIEMAATKDQELFRREEFQTTLAAVIKNCDSNELPQVLSVLHGLLSADPEARRDFFINKLFILCLDEAYTEISKIKIDVKISTEKYKKYFAISSFCQSNHILFSPAEKTNAGTMNKREKLFGMASIVASTAMFRAVLSPSKEERSQYRQCFSEIKKYYTYIEGTLGYSEADFVKYEKSFLQALQHFGSNDREQRQSFKSLVDGLTHIASKTTEKCNKGQIKSEAWVKNFISEASEFLWRKPKLMWAMLKMRKTNEYFSQRWFPGIINLEGTIGTRNDVSPFFTSVALQAIKQNNHSALTDEQVWLLCGGVDLADLLRTPQENERTIDMFLKFIQDRALASIAPKISFEDIMHADISDETYQRLMAFAEQGDYSENLKAFIKNGRKVTVVKKARPSQFSAPSAQTSGPDPLTRLITLHPEKDYEDHTPIIANLNLRISSIGKLLPAGGGRFFGVFASVSPKRTLYNDIVKDLEAAKTAFEVYYRKFQDTANSYDSDFCCEETKQDRMGYSHRSMWGSQLMGRFVYEKLLKFPPWLRTDIQQKIMQALASDRDLTSRGELFGELCALHETLEERKSFWTQISVLDQKISQLEEALKQNQPLAAPTGTGKLAELVRKVDMSVLFNETLQRLRF